MNDQIKAAIANGDYEVTDGGVMLPGSLRVGGVFRHYVNGELVGEDRNLLPTLGLNHILDVVFGATAKTGGWYLALFSGAVTPAANWTAANFAALASEITSTTEGYSGTRPAYTVGVAANGIVSNTAARAVFNIVCTTSVTVQGAAVLSSNVRGGTSGVLASASRFAAPRTFYNGDIYECEYELEAQPV